MIDDNPKVEKEFKDNVLLVSEDGEKYIVKFKKNPRSDKHFFSYLTDLLGLTKIHFQKEISVLNELEKISFDYFKYPRLIETDFTSYFMINYVDGVKKWKLNNHLKKVLVEALIEFQLKSPNVEFHLAARIIEPLFSPTGYILRESLTNVRKYCGYKIAARLLYLVIRMELNNVKQKRSLLIHRDLMQMPINYQGNFVFFKNIIVDEGDNIFFIDFGSVIKSKKFFYNDIVALAFNMETTKLDGELLKEYQQKLDNYGIIHNVNMESQVRMALLQIVLAEMNMNRLRDECIWFLSEILLSDENFTRWYTKQINKDF